MARAQSFASALTAGYFDAGTSVWVPASLMPVSVPFRFGVVWNGSWASPTTFYITPPNGIALSPQGATSYAVAWGPGGNPTKWVLMNSGVIPGPSYRNGEWHVRVEAQTMPGIPPSFPPTVVWTEADIDVAHLWVSSLQWSTSVQGATVSNAGPFVAVSTESGSPANATYALAVGDGYEPAAAELVNQTIELHTLPAGPTWSGVGPVPPAPALYTGTAYSLLPGLYWAQVLLSDGLGGVGSTEYLSRYLSVSALTKTSFDAGGARQGKLCFSVTTTDTGVNPITEKCYVVRRPDGTLLQPGGTAPSWSGGTTAGNLNTLAWPFAGTYVFALSYKDSGHEHLYHDNQPRWSHVGSTTIEIPAEAVFADECDLLLGSAFGSLATHHEGQLGSLPDGATHGRSFYSGRAPLGVRGGLVWCPTKADALASLQEDHVFCWEGHGWATNLALCTDWITTTDIASIPDGGLSQLRLAWLGSCGGMYQRQASSIGMRIKAKGAQAVFGYLYNAYPNNPGHQMFEKHAWEYLAQGYELREACEKALEDAEDAGYPVPGLEDDPTTPEEEGWHVGNGSQKIVPAFTLP